ncbi:MAG: hypothetical protein QMC95_02840 [Desulfitobacteriaceae bacterium]|nr:hypothetical protein [Desulfitobacteriaceae bacterium]MDI6913140.1 hypothetical protein [Desulfitobacteriaceae bacterium]
MITGRKIRSIKRLRNKKLKELQQKMAQCQKGLASVAEIPAGFAL